MATEFPIQGILDELVERIVEMLPIDAAGVTLISPPSHPHLIAASDESAMRFEQLQSDLGAGPCVEAYETKAPVAVADLAHDDRFPAFAEHALEEGLVAVFTFPLRDGELGLGALDLYRASAGLLDEDEMAAAQTMADVAAAYLLNAKARADLVVASAKERDALQKLRELDRAKTEYMATCIHELRTPVTSIAGYAELLEDEATGDLNPQQREFIASISRNSDRLTALANDLLTLSSLEPGTMIQHHSDIDLGEVVRSAQSALSALIDVRDLDVSFVVPAQPVLANGDARQLERLVSNLVSNAVKFTESGGHVRCRLQTVDHVARIEVSDDGIGIPEAEQGELFTRFFRSSTAQDHSIPGSGLGLTIADSIARRHGGSISVVSAHMAGSTFTVELPLQGRREWSESFLGDPVEPDEGEIED